MQVTKRAPCVCDRPACALQKATGTLVVVVLCRCGGNAILPWQRQVTRMDIFWPFVGFVGRSLAGLYRTRLSQCRVRKAMFSSLVFQNLTLRKKKIRRHIKFTVHVWSTKY